MWENFYSYSHLKSIFHPYSGEFLPPLHTFSGKDPPTSHRRIEGWPEGTRGADLVTAHAGSFHRHQSCSDVGSLPGFPHWDSWSSSGHRCIGDACGNSAAQREGKSADWRPLGFYSEKLEPAQLSYCAFYRELCTIFSGICHFRLQLEDRRYTIWTDQKPLTFALSYVSDCWTARKQRQLSYIAEFTADIVHVTGTQNIVVL